MTDFMTKSALQDLALLRFDHDRHNRDTKPLSKVSKYRNYCRKHAEQSEVKDRLRKQLR